MSKKSVIIFLTAISLCFHFSGNINAQMTPEEKNSEKKEFGDSWGIKVEGGLHPFISGGLYVDMFNIILDFNYAWDGKISGSSDGNFSNSQSSIFRLGADFKFNMSKKIPRFFLMVGGGVFWQSFKADVSSSMKQYSTFGSSASKVFTSGFISTGIVYNISKRFDFLGNVRYYFKKEETYWFIIPSPGAGVGETKIGSNVTSMNGPGITVGIYFKIGKI